MTQIIHVIPSISQEASGPTYVVKRLCETSLAAGLEVTLASLDWSFMTDNPEYLHLFPLGFGPRRLGRSPAMHRWLQCQARTGAVDIIHSHSLWMMPNVYPGLVCRQYDTPLLVAPHGTLSTWALARNAWIKRPFWHVLQRKALAAASCLHATSMEEYADIRRMGFNQPVAIIPNGIDVPTYKEKVDKGSRTLLFLGRIHPVKGLDLLLPAWQAVQARFPEWNLHITGPDNCGYLAEMQQLAEQLNLHRITFDGPRYGEAKWRAYHEADLFILPTYSENFGMSVAESLAAGTPAIVTQGAPWSGLNVHDAGRWTETHVDALVAVLEELMARSPADLTAMGRRGREWMARRYSWEHIGLQMRDTYKWVISGQSNGNLPSWIQLN